MERKQIRHRALRSCMSQKFSLELVHGLFIFRVQLVLIQLSFCDKGGIPDMQGLSATRAAAYTAELRSSL